MTLDEGIAKSHDSRLTAEKAEALGKASPAQLEALTNYRRILAESLGLSGKDKIVGTPIEQKLQYGEMLPGQIGLGNIDLNKRPVYMKFSKGTPEIRTENSITIDDGLGFVNIPTIVNGEQLSPEDAVMVYKLTGRHLGKFSRNGGIEPWKDAANAAEQLHLKQQSRYTGN